MIEYKVREVTRYIVTRWEGDKTPKPAEERTNSDYQAQLRRSCPTQHGEFANEDQAYEVADALAFKEREELGYAPGDERIQFPDRYKTKGA